MLAEPGDEGTRGLPPRVLVTRRGHCLVNLYSFGHFLTPASSRQRRQSVARMGWIVAREKRVPGKFRCLPKLSVPRRFPC